MMIGSVVQKITMPSSGGTPRTTDVAYLAGLPFREAAERGTQLPLNALEFLFTVRFSSTLVPEGFSHHLLTLLVTSVTSGMF